jgi:hypothetical protein
MSRLLEDLRANRVQTLHLDRRALWGRTKSLTRAAEDNWDNNNNNNTDEYEEEDQGQWWQEFFALLPSARKLQHVVVHDEVLPLLLPLPDLPASGNINSSSSNPLTRLLQVLPSLPQLRQLRLYVSRPATLEWSVLQDVVPACRKLEHIVLCHGTWWDPSFSTTTTTTSNNTAPGLALSSASDVTCLAKALAHHPCLTEVSLQDLVVRVPWDALLTALSTLPRLQVVNLTLQGSGGNLGGQQAPPRVSNCSLAAFLTVPTLQDVTLWSMGLDNAHMCALQQTLPNHSSLVFLSLRGNPGLTRTGGVQLCRAVEANTSLRSVYTDEWDDNDENSDEETLCLADWLAYILYWNQCGRGALLQSDAADTWHKALAQHAADLPTLYYLLRQGHAHVLPSSSSS